MIDGVYHDQINKQIFGGFVPREGTKNTVRSDLILSLYVATQSANTSPLHCMIGFDI